jgi:hypothetical protein
MTSSRPPAPPVAVVDSVDSNDRIDYHNSSEAPTAPGERAVPYHCPYCAEEDLRPLGPTPGAWHCRTCTRTFSVRYLGMVPPTPTWPTTSGTAPTPTPNLTPTGGTR